MDSSPSSQEKQPCREEGSQHPGQDGILESIWYCSLSFFTFFSSQRGSWWGVDLSLQVATSSCGLTTSLPLNPFGRWSCLPSSCSGASSCPQVWADPACSSHLNRHIWTQHNVHSTTTHLHCEALSHTTHRERPKPNLRCVQGGGKASLKSKTNALTLLTLCFITTLNRPRWCRRSVLSCR